MDAKIVKIPEPAELDRMVNDAFYDGYGRRMAEDEHTVIRTNIYKMIFLTLNGCFMPTQYDDPEPAMQDKKRAMKYVEALR